MNYLQMISQGGPIMIIIALCSVIAVYIFLQKWFQFHRAQVNVGELVAGLVNVLRRDGMIEAITLCDHTPGPVARMLTSAIHAYQNGDDMQARGEMLIAAYKAGYAFTRAGVGNVHAIAHTLGGLYGTPHGLANAVILPIVLEDYGEKVYPRLARLADKEN